MDDPHLFHFDRPWFEAAVGVEFTPVETLDVIGTRSSPAAEGGVRADGRRPAIPALAEWVAAFRAGHGRPPRLLHIGNVGNNGYNNAKLLNRAGLDCDAICYDYYHIMGCPEWEDADYTGDIRSDFYPTWTGWTSRLRAAPVVRPGPAVDLHRLPARPPRGPQRGRRQALGAARSTARGRLCPAPAARPAPPPPHRLGAQSAELAGKVARKFWKIPYLVALRCPAVHWLVMSLGWSPFITNVRRVCRQFAAAFPDRADQLHPAEFRDYAFTFPVGEVVPPLRPRGRVRDRRVYPMLVHHVPYVAFEHGTIRNIPFEPTPRAGSVH